MSIVARLLTTVIAGLASFGAVGIYTLLTGPPYTYIDLAEVMILFTVVYVPGIFASRQLLDAYAAESMEKLSGPAHPA